MARDEFPSSAPSDGRKSAVRTTARRRLEPRVSFYPYLSFAGNCREAFTRYQEIFGGELTLFPMSEVPMDDGQPPGSADVIAHASLVADGSLLMGADDPTGGFDGRNAGMCCNVTVEELETAERYFASLSEGGEVQMPLAETFFSPGFGMCVDRFGTPWMVVTDQPA
jgi:PhnB protein